MKTERNINYYSGKGKLNDGNSSTFISFQQLKKAKEKLKKIWNSIPLHSYATVEESAQSATSKRKKQN